MADFNKLRAKKASSTVIDPVEIFRRLPKPTGINDLYTSQAEVLTAWFGRREEKDLILKLHTGGGKTLVGLLIGQSTLYEKREPVVYLSPTNQLVDQTMAKAAEYGIPAVSYVTGADFPDEFLSGQGLLVANYHAMFNGMSRFGTRGGTREILHAAAIILDDAHAAFSTVRDQFTLSVRRDHNKEDYAFLTNLFRNDFREIDRLGSFDDVVTGQDFAVLEVPYWAWKEKLGQVQQYLKDHQAPYKFEWLFLRDSLSYCHCLIRCAGYYAVLSASRRYSDLRRLSASYLHVGDDW